MGGWGGKWLPRRRCIVKPYPICLKLILYHKICIRRTWLHIPISNKRCALCQNRKFRFKSLFTKKWILRKNYWSELYEIWHKCTPIHFNEVAKNRLSIAIFGVLLWGEQLEYRHPGGDELWNLIQLLQKKLYTIQCIPDEHNCMFSAFGITLHYAKTGNSTWRVALHFPQQLLIRILWNLAWM